MTLAWVPTMARMRVDLPQPRGAEEAGDLAARDVEVEAVEDRAGAADDGESAGTDDGLGGPGRARRRVIVHASVDAFAEFIHHALNNGAAR